MFVGFWSVIPPGTPIPGWTFTDVDVQEPVDPDDPHAPDLAVADPVPEEPSPNEDAPAEEGDDD